MKVCCIGAVSFAQIWRDTSRRDGEAATGDYLFEGPLMYVWFMCYCELRVMYNKGLETEFRMGFTVGEAVGRSRGSEMGNLLPVHVCLRYYVLLEWISNTFFFVFHRRGAI